MPEEYFTILGAVLLVLGLIICYRADHNASTAQQKARDPLMKDDSLRP